MHLCIVLVNASVKGKKYFSGMVEELFGQVYIAYGTILWDNSSFAKSIFSSQKQAMIVLFKVPVRSHCKQTYIDSKTMSLPCTYIAHFSMPSLL